MYNWKALDFEVTAIMVFVFMSLVVAAFSIYHQFRVRKRMKGLEDLWFEMDEKLDVLLQNSSNTDFNVAAALDDLMEIKDRMTFLEATSIVSMSADSPSSARSQGAKEMWKRRRQGKIEKKDGL